MKTQKRKATDQQFGTYLGVDLGERKHHVCVTDKDGKILEEFTAAPVLPTLFAVF